MVTVSDIDYGILCPLVHVSGSPRKAGRKNAELFYVVCPTASLFMSLKCMYCSQCCSF